MRLFAAAARTCDAQTCDPVLASVGNARSEDHIDHLPEDKQRKLREITAIFTEPREGSPIGMLILSGSHARGDWVEDTETGYQSDYGFLVVLETAAQVADVMLWREIEQRVRAVIGDTPLTLIVHDVKFVNREIRIGQYCFSDIANEGVMLYDSRKNEPTTLYTS